MPLQTRNIAKGIPPRVHLPKSTKPKPSAGKKDSTTKAAPTKKNRKWHASTSEDESGQESKDSEPKARKKKHARREVSEEEEVAEEVNDNPIPEPPMEQVIDIDDEQAEQSNEDEVSTKYYITQRMNELTGWAQDGLNDHQCRADLQEKLVKKDSTLDIHTIMSDTLKVKFIVGADKYEVDTRRWCNICK